MRVGSKGGDGEPRIDGVVVGEAKCEGGDEWDGRANAAVGMGRLAASGDDRVDANGA